MTRKNDFSIIILNQIAPLLQQAVQTILNFLIFLSHRKESPVNEVKVKRNAAATVFSDLFSFPKYQLQIYHALHPEDTDITAEQLANVTLSSILVTGIYNDLGFTVRDKRIILIEAQSTWSVNITYRCLEYLLGEWKQHLSRTEQNIYGKKAVRLPSPELYVLYTGEEPHHETELKLSREIFPGQDIPVEAVVKILYRGKRGDILDQYVRFTEILRETIRENGYDASTAEKVVNRCIRENILTDYMKERGAEIMAAMLDIFDQEKVWDMALKAERREGREEGREEGAAGIIRICRQMMHLDDQAIIQILMKEMNLPQNRAVAILYNYDHPSSSPD